MPLSPLRPLLMAAVFMVGLLAGLAAPALAQPLDPGSMTPEQRQDFRKEVRDYLMDNPEVLIEAIQVLERRQAAQQVRSEAELLQDNHAAIFDDGYSFVGGNPDGDITLVEFMDYRCSFCRQAHPEVAELLKNDGRIRWIVKEFPILGPDSTLASRFAIAVLDLGGADAYGRAHDALMTMRAKVSTEALEKLAGDLGLDAGAVLARMGSAEVTKVIDANHALAQRLQISGTPTFILQDRFLRGYVPLDALTNFVAEARNGG